jgi:hypothetical protein
MMSLQKKINILVNDKNSSITYEEVYHYGLTTEAKIRDAVIATWPGLGLKAITIRSRKVLTKVQKNIRPSNKDYIENSVWRVTWDLYAAYSSGKYSNVIENSYPSDTVISIEKFATLGYVCAPDEAAAVIIARATLGSRAQDKISVSRIGVGGWGKVHGLNIAHANDCKKIIEKMKAQIQMKINAIDIIEHSVSMMQISAIENLNDE